MTDENAQDTDAPDGTGEKAPGATAAAAADAPAAPLGATTAASQGAARADPGAPASGTTHAARKPARTASAKPTAPKRPKTLCIDVGGTGLKASVVDAGGKLVADRVRVPTTYPCPPERLVEMLTALVAPLPGYERVAVGFPGVVRRGVVLSAPHFVTAKGPGSNIVPKLETAWHNFALADAMSSSLGKPVRTANDADLQGLEVASGEGLELVVTLGTGVGTALLTGGRLAPHLELAHHPFRKGGTYNDQLGDAALRRIGPKKWRRRVDEAIANFESLFNYDRLFVGGGNARHLKGHVGADVTLVDNVAGILGGLRLWEIDPL